MKTEDEYIKIGKAVIDECIAQGGERRITITLRSVQFGGKLYFLIEDVVDPISIWSISDIEEVSLANRTQELREEAEARTTEKVRY